MAKTMGDPEEVTSAEIRHLPRREILTESDARSRDQKIETTIANHFREQNQILRDNNKELSDQIRRLTTGVESLVREMHGVRTGAKEEAFARVTGVGAAPDLPTVSAEAALIYIYTAKQIGEMLGFHCSQIGFLLSARGLNWVGNGDYQEIGRTTGASQSKFWHREVPDRLRKILDENKPEKYGIREKPILTMFRRWQERKLTADLVRAEPSGQTH